MSSPSKKSTTPGRGDPKSKMSAATTPSRRAQSADPPSRKSSARRSAIHTPLANTTSRDLLSSVRRSASARKTNAPTPHARAAARALDQRRTAIFTPGKNRRRSLREQRETPRDVLRALSHALAPTSQAVPSSSSPGGDATTSGRSMRSRVATILEDDEDDDIEIDRPRLSLPLEEDDDSDLHPPRLSDVADYTARSVEMPRRALSEQPRLSRGSPGSIRMSDFRGADLDEEMEFGVDSGYFPGANFDDAGLGAAGEDVTYERIDEERRQTLAMNRESFGLEMPDINESTFVMNLQPPSDGEPEPGPADDTAPIFDLEAEVDVNDEEGADDMEEEMAGQETQVNGADATETGELSRVEQLRRKRKRGIKVSAFGVEYPSLPPPVIKRIAQSYARTSGIPKTKISPDTLAALSQASDWFFEQLGDSLQAYAKHAGRKTIDESDVITLMRRQRQVGPKSTPFSLAQRHLPRELLQGLRMSVPVPVRKRRKANVEEDDDG